MVHHYSKLPTNTFREQQLVDSINFDVHCGRDGLLMERDVHLHAAVQAEFSPVVVPRNFIWLPEVAFA